MLSAARSIPAPDSLHEAPSAGTTGWTIASYAYALAAVSGIAYCVWGIPVQLSDSLGNMLQVQEVSLLRVVQDQLGARAYLRPLLWAQIKIVFDASAGHYFLAFKTVHTLQLVALALLFVRPLRIRTAEDFWPLPIAMAVLVGLHTFAGTVREAFPINSFLTVIICCLAAVNLAMSHEGRWWKDLAAALLVGFAIFTVESGLLVFVCLFTAWMTGLRGVSRGGIAASAAVLVVYFGARFLLLDVGMPGLAERPSGFGFAILEPGALQARFGDSRMVFYVHNVLASLLSVLFSEPRNGVFWAVRAWWIAGQLPPWLWINLASSLLATALIGWHLMTRGLVRRGGALTDHDRLAIVASALLVANAGIGFGYTKDVIVSAGGVGYALLVYVAAHALLVQYRRLSWPAARVALAIIACVGAVAWSTRDVALHVNLRQWAARERTEWAHAYEWLEMQRIPVETSRQRALVSTLQADALSRTAPLPAQGGWLEWLDLN
jgi:hypothetical protein